MCNCIKDTEIGFKKYLIENNTNFTNKCDLEVEFENKAILLNRGVVEITLPMRYSWKHTAKSGRVSTKKKIQHFTIKYCPFCGNEL